MRRALLCFALLVPASGRAEDSSAASLYVRADTDATTVISPRLRVRTQALEDTHLDLAYAVDVWTSASVDIVASASSAVTEQRDEVNLGVDHRLGDLTLGAGYRLSLEPDYVSHGGSASLSWDLAHKAATLALNVAASRDSVSQVGDETFSDEVGTLSAGLAFTQVLDTRTVMQGIYDIASVSGYQASAYRYVGIGGDGTCLGTAPLCIRERNPRERLRHALALRLRRALSTQWSAGAGYRLYFDDWGITSHTLRADMAWAPTQRSTLALSYRLYTQGAADHYQALYLDADAGNAFFTSDKELSPLSSHRLGLELDWRWEIDDGQRTLSTALMLAPTLYQYSDFRALDRISAFEVTAAVGMDLP